VLTPTPPPDIDVEAWRASIELVSSWQPESLGITHFDAVEEPDVQLEAAVECLERWAGAARELDGAAFERRVRDEIRAATDPEAAATYEQAMPPEQMYLGLERYWRKRDRG
jgi:hypothetical protein